MSSTTKIVTKKVKKTAKYSQIRINKTPELEEILAFFRSEYYLFDDNDIIKAIISKEYSQKIERSLVDIVNQSRKSSVVFSGEAHEAINFLNAIDK